MAEPKTPEEIKSGVFEWLKSTRYASTSLEPLSGGSSNFVYRAKLSEPLEDGTTNVLVKHGEGYMRVPPYHAISTGRCKIEELCLKTLEDIRGAPDPSEYNATKYIVRTPKCYLYDDTTHNIVLEYFPQGVNLKAYALKNFPSPTPESLRPQCHQLGKALAEWITEFQQRDDPKLREALQGNEDMRKIRYLTYYKWVLDRVDQFPSILSEAKEVFEKFVQQADKEMKHPENLTLLHGDYWTGNMVLPDAPIQEGAEIPVFVTDLEMAHIGPPILDHGEMLGEIYVLWLYKKMDAGLWMLQGYAEGLGEKTDAFSWRLAQQIGCHLITIGTMAPGWGTPEQVEGVIRLGRDTLVNAWEKRREWFDDSELGCLFSPVV